MGDEQQRISNVKRVLSAYIENTKRFDRLVDERTELRAKAVYRGPKIDGVVAHGQNDMPDKFVEVLARLDIIDREILEISSKLPILRNQLQSFIDRSELSNDERIILQYRYALGYKWRIIVEKTGFGISYVKRLHAKALDILANIMEEENLSKTDGRLD